MSTPSEEAPGTYAGRFSDGKTASGAPTAVRLAVHGIEIVARGGQAPLVWTYSELATSSPVSRHAGDVLLSSASAPGATLFVADRGFVAALIGKASHLTTAAQRWRFARPLLAVGAAVVSVVAGLWIADVSPARILATWLPTEARQALGRQVLQSMAQGRATCETPEGSAALGRLTERLSAATDGKRFTVNVLNSSIVNAFAAPGEQIVLTRGLIERAKSSDEIAGVLGHEMGHGIELHPETGIIRAIGLAAVVELMLGGSGGTLANVGLILTQLGYTRIAEREADARALQILEKAQISPLGFANFFKRMEGNELGSLAILRTHPLSAERARLATAKWDYPTTPALSDSDWQALREICVGLPIRTPRPPSRKAKSDPGTEL